MKIHHYILVFLLAITSAHAQVVISQVYANPLSSESGGEFVELRNNGDTLIDISGWILSTETSTTDATIPANILLSPGKTFLIADSGFQTSKDNPSWPDADLEEPITLNNADSGVAIKDPDLNIIDSVGWGDQSGIQEGLFEGTPASIPEEGMALVRTQDTNNNIDDFQLSQPSFSVDANPSNSEIKVSFSIVPEPLVLESFTLTPDEEDTEGIQIFPNPANNKEVFIDLLVSGGQDSLANLQASARFQELSIPLTKTVHNQTHASLKGSLLLNFSLLPGDYPVSASLSSGSASLQTIESFTYLPLLAFSVDAEQLNFVNLTPGSNFQLNGDKDPSTKNSPTLQNMGNVPLNMEVRGSPFTSLTGESLLDILSISFNGISSLIKSTADLLPIHLLPGGVSDIGFYGTLPTNASIGDYTGSVYLTGVSAEV